MIGCIWESQTLAGYTQEMASKRQAVKSVFATLQKVYTYPDTDTAVKNHFQMQTNHTSELKCYKWIVQHPVRLRNAATVKLSGGSL